MQDYGYMYGDMEDTFLSERPLTRRPVEANEVNQGYVQRQHKMDSFMEAACNTAVGFFISWAVWVWVVAPLFGFHNGAGTSFLVTCIFTVTSLLRQYILRRMFDGKTIWETVRGKFTR